LRAQSGDAIKRFERTILVAEAGENQGLFMGILRCNRQLLRLAATTDFRIDVTEKPIGLGISELVPGVDEKLQRFPEIALAQPDACQTGFSVGVADRHF
jgi:hypothetical protein